MIEQTIPSNSKKFDKINYSIKRESKTIKFEDINLIEEESNYLIEFNDEIKPNHKYLFETPFSYFQIPEKIRLSINPKLMEINSKQLYEKIIWYYIFEIIYGNKDNEHEWENVRKNIKNKIKDDYTRKKRKKNSKDISLSEETKDKLREINLRKLIEEKKNIKEILVYPHSKKKTLFHPIWNIKKSLFLLLISFILLSISVVFYGTHDLYLLSFYIAFSLSLVCLLYLILYEIIAKKSLLKGGKLKKKFEEVVNEFTKNLNVTSKKEKDFIRTFLDIHSNELFHRLYYLAYNELFEAIKDYKTFNPISINITFDKEEIIHEKTESKGFFHFTSILLDFNKIPIKEKYLLKIKTTRTLRIIKKKERITREKLLLPKYFIPIFIFLFLLPFIFFMFFINNIIFFIGILIIIALFLLILSNLLTFEYRYYSPLQEHPRIASQYNKFYYHYFNKNKSIYSLPTSLRKDCSYYWSIYAPRFHKIRIAKEIKKIIKNMEQPIVLRSPYELSRNILSFHIPRGQAIKETNFQLDLEIPYSTRIIGWLIGMNIMLINMLTLSVIYLFMSITSTQSFDLTNIRVVLPFLTLLIGFFGKSILENPTKDLYKWGGILIFLTVLIGIVLFLTSIINLITY